MEPMLLTVKRVCSTCNIEYDQKVGQFKTKCPECYKTYQREWRAKHPNYMTNKGREFRAKNPEHVKEYNTKYKQTPEYKKRKKAYKKTEYGRAIEAAGKSRRRARKKGNGGKHTAKEWLALKAQYNNACLACGCTECEITKDHVIPLAKGGTDNIDNLQPLCMACNVRKSTDDIDYR